ncbi:hypothetical protein, conserved [Trypanosoma brucei gambiense DAL972]|uniref:Uncharacterized protein n=1 Tax=Trypanosoma brucei gambiense (strain MHOM/CI/86/DAL972) TaxID=679716 RepID=D0A1E3_TRYB9|nr:hypothetical protein, conserved [Trypanosoma brucei gambiense DAL972]CBH15085.1 hypothetical protein, conserved [Trypanosoma brucei gambiense DAL972]|eukprot:XP_011777351.1 hypothetical protein, conserved [Trypanosoma brucei gambiense DAL972]
MDGPFATMDEETRKTYMDRGRAMMEARRAEILSHSPEKFEQLRRQGYIIFKRYLQGEQWMPLQGKLHSPLITTSEEPSKAHKQNMGSSGSSHLPQDDNITAKECNIPTTKLAEWCAPTDKSLFPESTPAEPEELHHVALLTMCGPSVSCVDGDDEDFKQLSYNKDVATLHKTMEIQHQQIEQLSAQLRNQESEIDVLTNELKGVTEANARQLQKEEELQSLQEALQERDRELQLRLESVNEQNDSLKTQIMELHILLELKAKELQKLKDDNNALRGEVVTIQNEGDTIKENETKCKERILQLEAANSELGVQVDVSKKEVEAAHQCIKNLEQELTRERKINEDSTVAYNKVKKELECKEKPEQQKQEEIKQRKRAEKAMIRELSELQDRIHTLESTQETENNSSTAGIPLNPFAKMVIQGEASQPRVEDDDDAVVFGVEDSVTPSVCVETGMALRVKELEMCISSLQQQLESERADAAREVDSLRHRIAENDELLRQKLEEYKAEQEAKFLEELEACRTGNESDDAIFERLNALQACNDQLKEELRELEERQQVELANVTQEAADRIAEHDELLRQKLEEYKAEQEAKFLEELEACRTGNESDDAIFERLNALQACNDQLKEELRELEERQQVELANVTQEAADRIAEHDELLRQKLEEYKAEQEAKFLEELEACRTGNESDDAIFERLNALQACNDQLKEELRELEERQQVELANVTQEAADRIAEHDELLRQKLEEYKAEQEAKFLEELEACRTGNESDDAIFERLNALQACNDQLKEELRELEERQQVELANVTQEAADRIAEHDELLRQKLEEYKAEQEAKFLEELEACRTGNESDDAIFERLNALQACNDQLKEELRELEERQQVELANVTQEAADRIAEHDELLRQKLEEYKAEQEAKFLEELEACRTGNESDDAIFERLNALQACNDQLKEELRELEERQQVELANVTQEAADRIAEHDELLRQKLEEYKAEQEAKFLEELEACRTGNESDDAIFERLNALQACNDQLKEELRELEERQQVELANVTQEAADRIAEHDELLRQKLEEYKAEQEAKFLEELEACRTGNESDDAIFERLNALQACNDQLKEELRELEERQQVELANVTQEAADRIAEHDELLRQKLEEYKAEQEAKFLEELEACRTGNESDDAIFERLNALQACNDQLKEELRELEERQQVELANVTQEAADRIAEHDELLRQKLEEYKAEQEAKFLEELEACRTGNESDDAILERLNALQACNDQLKEELRELEERQQVELANVTQEAADRIAEHDELLRQKLEEYKAEQEAKFLEELEACRTGNESDDAIFERLNALQACNDQLKEELRELEERQQVELANVTQEAADRIAEHDELLRQKLEEYKAEQEAKFLEELEACRTGNESDDAIFERLNALQACNDQLKEELRELEERQQVELANVTQLAGGTCGYCGGTVFVAATSSSVGSVRSFLGADSCLPCINLETADCGVKEAECCISHKEVVGNGSHSVDVLKGSEKVSSRVQTDSLEAIGVVCRSFVDMTEDRENGERVDYGNLNGLSYCNFSGDIPDDIGMGNLVICRKQSKCNKSCHVDDGVVPLDDSNEAELRVEDCQMLLDVTRNRVELQREEQSSLHSENGGSEKEVHTAELDHTTLKHNVVEDLFAEKVLTIPLVVQYLFRAVLDAHEYLVRHHVNFQRKLLSRCDVIERAASDAMIEGERQCEDFMAVVEGAEVERQGLLRQITELQQEVATFKASSERVESELCSNKEEHSKVIRKLHEKLDATQHEMEVVKVEYANSLHKMELVKTENANVLHLFYELKKTAADVEDEQRREVVRLQEALREKTHTSRELLELTEQKLAAALEEVDQCKCSREDLEKQLRSTKSSLDRVIPRLERAETERDSLESQLLDATQEVQLLTQRNRTAEEAFRRQADALTATVEELREANTKLGESCKEQQAQLDSLKAQLSVAETELERLRMRATQQESDAQRLNGKLCELESSSTLQVEEAAAALRAAEMRIAALEPRKAALQEEVDHVRRKNCELQGCCDELKERLRQAADTTQNAEQMHNRRVQQLNEQVEALQLEVKQLQEAHDGLVADREQLVREQVGAAQETERIKQNLERCNQQKERLQNEIQWQRESYESEIQAAQETLNGAREELSKWRHTLEEAEAQQNAMRDTISMLQVERTSNHEQIRAVRLQLREYQELLAQERGYLHETGLKFLRSCSDECSVQKSPSVPYTPQRECGTRETCSLTSAPAGCCDSQKTQGSASQKSIARLRSIVAQKSLLLEEREAQVESLYSEMKTAIVHVVQEARNAQLGSKALAPVDQRELLLNNIMHNLLLRLGRLSRVVREPSTDSTGSGSRDPANAEVSPNSSTNPEAVLNFSSAATPKERVSGGGDESTDAR